MTGTSKVMLRRSTWAISAADTSAPSDAVRGTMSSSPPAISAQPSSIWYGFEDPVCAHSRPIGLRSPSGSTSLDGGSWNWSGTALAAP
ncbi:hypothetical protein ACFY1B_17395 [Streptomyces mirabilis]|uniref:hypothetical protein n=1 Tax=Streptomyces mirabilis TaxID=68239 RepID=UPI003698192C